VTEAYKSPTWIYVLSALEQRWELSKQMSFIDIYGDKVCWVTATMPIKQAETSILQMSTVSNIAEHVRIMVMQYMSPVS